MVARIKGRDRNHFCTYSDGHSFWGLVVGRSSSSGSAGYEDGWAAVITEKQSYSLSYVSVSHGASDRVGSE